MEKQDENDINVEYQKTGGSSTEVYQIKSSG